MSRLSVACGALVLAAIGLPIVASEPAQAFSDPSLFEEGAAKGGSAGRQFTGSPDDPFTCNVCHDSGQAPFVLNVEGWPATLGEDAYDLRIALPGPDTSVALQFEVFADGLPAELQLPDASELLVGERCDGDAEGAPAAYVRDVGERRVIGVSDCGAAELRVRLLAPEAQRLELWAAGVLSDGEADVLGDRVAEVALASGTGGAPGAGCSSTGRNHAPLWCVFLLLGIIPRRARRKLFRSTPTRA